MENWLYQKQKDIFNAYNDRLKHIVGKLEIEYVKHPVSINVSLYEIHNLFADCSRIDLTSPEGLQQAELCLQQIDDKYAKTLADCYYYTYNDWGASVGWRYWFIKSVANLTGVESGMLKQKCKDARDMAHRKAEAAEAKYVENRFKESLEDFEAALESIEQLDQLLDDNIVEINRLVWKGVVKKVFYAIIAIIGCLYVLL
ncbi:MAG: hypothetical protein IJ533_02885 [Prevotella sp.]|nr:hypothetical protein [Prevotella sp.]